MRKCKECNIEKPITDFHKSKGSLLGRNTKCKDCIHEKQRVYRKSTGYAATIKSKYGITMDEYEAMKKQQDQACKICQTKFDTSSSRMTHPMIDHCHNTGKVRGIICHACNVALGMVKDNPTTLKRMIKYLRAM